MPRGRKKKIDIDLSGYSIEPQEDVEQVEKKESEEPKEKKKRKPRITKTYEHGINEFSDDDEEEKTNSNIPAFPEKPENSKHDTRRQFFSTLTKEEISERARIAAAASHEARRKKRDLRALTQLFLMSDANPQLKKNMEALGLDGKYMTNLAAIITRLFTKVVTSGDITAARTLIEWAGMAPLQQEKENQQLAQMTQMIAMAQPEQKEESDDDVVFYIPDNGREVVQGDMIYKGAEDAPVLVSATDDETN